MGYYETDKKNARFFGLKLNYVTDKDLIDKLLSVDSIQSYLKQLIRADIESGAQKKGVIMNESLTLGQLITCLVKLETENGSDVPCFYAHGDGFYPLTDCPSFEEDLPVYGYPESVPEGIVF